MRYGTATTPDRPEVEVRVDGRAVEPLVQRDVVEVDVGEEVGRHARLDLLLQNWDPDTRTVRHSDDGPFAPGTQVQVLLGYHSELEQVFDGVVVAVTAHFPAGGQPVLRVQGRSRSALLDHPARSRQLEDVSDADVVAAVAADHGLRTESEPGVTRPAVVSDRRSDWDLLTARAAELGWVTYVRGTTLVFRPPVALPPDGPDGPLELEYGLNVTEMHLTQDLTRSVDPVVAAGWDPQLDVLESEAGPGQADLPHGDRPDHGAALADAGWSGREERIASASLVAADAADAVAAGRQRAAALAHVHGTVAVVGNPALRCDGWVRVTGVGERLSGPHYVTAARHRLSARGYRTELQVGRPPALVPPVVAAARGALTVGVVASLEDPEALNRIKVRMPWRGDGGDGVWARQAALDAGDGYGAVVLPDVGQEVLVGTVDGDDATLVVLGALVNGAQPPPVVVSEDANLVRALVTPGGHRFVLEDGDAAAVVLETPAGNRLRLAEADSQVSLTHGDSGSSLTISADGIVLDAAQGDVVLRSASGAVTLDAVRIEGSSSGPSKLASSATFDLTASATLGLTGALVTIN